MEKLANTSEILDPEAATQHRACAARADYIALDRPDISFATKELCRAFQSPTRDAVDGLNKVVRYLVGKSALSGGLAISNCSQKTPSSLMLTQTLGCHVARRSTSGGLSMRGRHVIKHWSSTQSTVALSSAEAELTGICRGAAQGIGLQSLARDINIELTLEVKTDAKTAIGICKRRGLGRVRHLHTADLWVQDKVRTKAFALTKIDGKLNPADALTNNVDRQTLERHVRTMGLRFEEGRPDSAPTIEHRSLVNKYLHADG